MLSCIFIIFFSNKIFSFVYKIKNKIIDNDFFNSDRERYLNDCNICFLIVLKKLVKMFVI